MMTQDDNTPTSRQDRQTKRHQQENRFFWGVVVAFIILAVITGIYSFQFVRDGVVKGWEFPTPSAPGTSQVGTDSTAEPGVSPTAVVVNPPDDGGEVEAALPEWDGKSRVNILILGLDYIDWREGEGPPRSDTMILVTIDPADNSASMLSIPRDLWVNIPGFGSNRINTAYMNGEASRLPGGGPALASKTVEEFLGIEIHFYAQISFDTFVQFIDLIGGVKVDVPEDIKVVLAYKDGHKIIPAGVQRLDGELTLAYVRARNSEGGDFDRSARQQAVIMGIRRELLAARNQSMLLGNAVELWNNFVTGIDTNITFEEARKLGLLALKIDTEAINSYVIAPPDYVIPETTNDGAQVLKPITQKIRILRDEVFTSSSLAAPAAKELNITELLATENARVSVLNGSGVAGLAADTETYLLSMGVNVIGSGNADEFVSYTKIYDYTGKLYTMQYLIETMGIQMNKIFNRFEPDSTVDIVIVLGPDWRIP